MKIALLNDIHLEFDNYDYNMPDADILILTGDIFVISKFNKKGNYKMSWIGPDLNKITNAISKEDARDFVDFVLRHTYPERAEKRTLIETYELIRNHPFAKMYISNK